MFLPSQRCCGLVLQIGSGGYDPLQALYGSSDVSCSPLEPGSRILILGKTLRSADPSASISNTDTYSDLSNDTSRCLPGYSPAVRICMCVWYQYSAWTSFKGEHHPVLSYKRPTCCRWRSPFWFLVSWFAKLPSANAKGSQPFYQPES